MLTHLKTYTGILVGITTGSIVFILSVDILFGPHKVSLAKIVRRKIDEIGGPLIPIVDLSFVNISHAHREYAPMEGNLIPNPNAENYILCNQNAQLGNNMFQFASAFGIAAQNNMSVVIDPDFKVAKYFDIKTTTSRIQNEVLRRREKRCCTFDEKMLTLQPNENYILCCYLQSWKYFIKSAAAIRKNFVFKQNIQLAADHQINSAIQKRGINVRSEATLVGVHVRRGDLVKKSISGRRTIATKQYLHKAVQYFVSQHFLNLIFIVCSNDIPWSRESMPANISVDYMENNSAPEDLAILGSCDHIIQTVGTFSWWGAWLANGQSTYYKWPAFNNSKYRNSYSEDYMDYFYPGWVGL